MITPVQANQFAQEWIAAWNSHDLNRILAQEPMEILDGKSAVSGYWAKALELLPDMRFELLATFVGADRVAIHYRGVRGSAVEVLIFNSAGRVCRAAAHYL